MGKLFDKIPGYQYVRKHTTGTEEYGFRAHIKSGHQFLEKHERKAGIEDIQELRDMAEARIKHFNENASIPWDCYKDYDEV